MTIHENVQKAESMIRDACDRSGRARSDIHLVAISKTFPASAIDEAIEAGVTDIGENRVQECREKKSSVRRDARWHLVGHLQSNKAGDAAELFDVVETIDSASLGRKLDRAAERRLEVMIQVNIGREPQKSGVDPDETEALARELSTLDSLLLVGLMAIPPLGGEEETRSHFRAMRELRDRIRDRFGTVSHLSIGMSEDFTMAIEEGATVIRLGRAIFGGRDR